MSQTSPPTITGSPTVPQRSDRATFSSRVDAFVTWMAAAVTEFGAVAANVYNNAVDAYSNAVAASASASTASSAAASAIAASGATLWVSGTTYSLGAVVWSPVNAQSYRRIVAGAGTTDPSADATNWTLLGAAAGSNNLGYLNIPQNSQSTAYTCVLADAGKHILHPSADTTARTFTIPANASVAYPIGTALTFVNQASAGVMTIAITTDTMRLAGAGTTGSRTLAANGVATAIKLTSTEWIISGTNLT